MPRHPYGAPLGAASTGGGGGGGGGGGCGGGQSAVEGLCTLLALALLPPDYSGQACLGLGISEDVRSTGGSAATADACGGLEFRV